MPPKPPSDLAARVELRLEPTAPKANAVALLARLLRRVRDRERQERAAKAEAAPPAGGATKD
jgi:hypothetical protein